MSDKEIAIMIPYKLKEAFEEALVASGLPGGRFRYVIYSDLGGLGDRYFKLEEGLTALMQDLIVYLKSNFPYTLSIGIGICKGIR